MELFQRIPISLAQIQLDEVIDLAASLNIYAYDACMIACARQSGTPLLTLDGGLRDAARRAGVGVTEVTT